LQKAYELALQQEKTAAQNVESLKATIKSQLDGADLQYRNALITLQGLYDSHLVIAPISGKITKKAVANGDTVSAGQILGAISQTEDIKLQFYVDQENLTAITVGLPVSIRNSDNKILPGKVVSVSPRADDLTKRFIIEVSPDQKDYESFVLGTVMSVLVDIEKKVTEQNSIIVPLSAVEIGQNANYIFTVKDNIAKKVEIKLIKVEGETAQIQTDLPPETIIVVDGNKLIQDGDQVSLTQ
ncbi:MAG: efflux RND transporter periplasmic adaptor subunit, partial [Candidatus Buchananbacteria bacterium]